MFIFRTIIRRRRRCSLAGFLTEVISAPVISGFTSASAIIIIVSQVKHILGVNYKSDSFNDDVAKAFQNAGKFQPGDTILGVLCIAFLLSLRVSDSYSRD